MEGKGSHPLPPLQVRAHRPTPLHVAFRSRVTLMPMFRICSKPKAQTPGQLPGSLLLQDGGGGSYGVRWPSSARGLWGAAQGRGGSRQRSSEFSEPGFCRGPCRCCSGAFAFVFLVSSSPPPPPLPAQAIQIQDKSEAPSLSAATCARSARAPPLRPVAESGTSPFSVGRGWSRGSGAPPAPPPLVELPVEGKAGHGSQRGLGRSQGSEEKEADPGRLCELRSGVTALGETRASCSERSGRTAGREMPRWVLGASVSQTDSALPSGSLCSSERRQERTVRCGGRLKVSDARERGRQKRCRELGELGGLRL